MEKLSRLYLVMAMLSLAFKGHSQASDAEQYKTWIPNTNWNNGQNWASGSVPCPLQDVQLGNPKNSSPLSIALTGQNSLKSLSLPVNGELVFHKDAEITFYQDREVVLDKCTAKGNIQFIASAPKLWYNPSNWQVTDGDGNPVSNVANDILHLEKVPCQHDQVLFPKDSSFKVASTNPITVASVTINGERYSQSSFKDFLKTESGAMQFHLSTSSVQLTGETCSDPRGCLCNTNQGKTAICSHVTCVLPQCSKPLEPTGSCCTYCGTLMVIKPGASFRLDKFKSKIMSLTAKLAKGMPQVSISRVDDKIQVVFTDSSKGEEAQRLAKQVSDETSGSSDFTIIETLQSGQAIRTRARKGDSKSYALPIGVGIGLLLLAILVIIAVVIWRKKRNAKPERRRYGTGNEERLRSHSLQLIEANQNRIELQEMPADVNKEGAEHHQDAHVGDYKKLQSDNLLYESAEERKTFDNPLYDSEENLDRVV